jgi:hypothetical protein
MTRVRKNTEFSEFFTCDQTGRPERLGSSALVMTPGTRTLVSEHPAARRRIPYRLTSPALWTGTEASNGFPLRGGSVRQDILSTCTRAQSTNSERALADSAGPDDLPQAALDSVRAPRRPIPMKSPTQARKVIDPPEANAYMETAE